MKLPWDIPGEPGELRLEDVSGLVRYVRSLAATRDVVVGQGLHVAAGEIGAEIAKAVSLLRTASAMPCLAGEEAGCGLASCGPCAGRSIVGAHDARLKEAS